jgi:uncharacterized Rossmann fold enzyme
MKPPVILDASQPQSVQYAIPLWLRDEQIKLAIQRVKARIEPHPARTTPGERVAVVCFGPSLNETWEQVREYPFIISCSGSHKFLIERGIVPTWHIEVDPRRHKIALIGEPHPSVQYLIASTCAPEVFDHLAGFDVKLWHVFDGEAEALRVLPHGEWAITGGCSVGLRAMGIAAFLGFRDVHVFGMDGSEGATGKHAAEHPNQPKDYCSRRTTAWSTARRRRCSRRRDRPSTSSTSCRMCASRSTVKGSCRRWRSTMSRRRRHSSRSKTSSGFRSRISSPPSTARSTRNSIATISRTA